MAPVNHRLLRLAREAQALSQVELGRRSGVSQGAISKYEKGLIQPGVEHLSSLGEALGFPVSFFEQQEVRPANVLYRSRSLRSAKAEATVRARLNLARLVAISVLQDVNIETPARFPEPDARFESPDHAAGEIRRLWWLPPGPLDDIAGAIEAAGGVVIPVNLGNDAVIAAYLQPMGDPVRWFFINTGASAGDRVRFSLAHELGHAVLHTFDLLPESAEAEREAHQFGASFQMPPKEFAAEFPRGRIELSTLLELKLEWKVSMQAIATHAQRNGLIGRDDLTRLYRQMSARGWRTREPGHVPMERGKVFSTALSIQRQEHGLSDIDLARLVHLHPSALVDLLPEHFSPAGPRRLHVVSARA